MMHETFVKIGLASELKTSPVQCLTVGQRELVLVYDDGNFYALDNLCPHKEARLCSGKVSEGHIECPWHGARFNIATGKCYNPVALKGVQTWPVKMVGDDVYIYPCES